MSRAFTKEDDQGAAPLTRAPPQVAAGEKRYVTPEGHRALEQELHTLLTDSPASPRIALLRSTLSVLTVLAPPKDAECRVVFGSWVTLQEADGEPRRYRIVGPDEADARTGLLSVDAPLARALMGKEPGDSVELMRPRGRTELTILEVAWQP